MTKKETIICLLGKYDVNLEGKTRTELTELYYKDYSNIVDKRREYYKKQNKTEEFIFNQIEAELGSNIVRDKSLFISTKNNGRLITILTSKGLAKYNKLLKEAIKPFINF